MTIEQWVDIDSKEFKEIVKQYALVRRLTLRMVEMKVAIPDKNGYLYSADQKVAIHTNAVDGKTIGLRYAAKAPN